MPLLEEVYDRLLGFLRTNIDNPVTPGKKWIYPDYPRVDASFPRIAILHMGTYRTEIGVGGKGDRHTHLFEISVWVDTKSEATIDTEKYKGNKLREYIGDKVIKTLIDKRKDLRVYNILDIYLREARNLPYDPDTRLWRKNIIIEVQTEEYREIPY